ncbi:hypothetical protein GGR52DRAFT_318939 [Hypoxylon sp. FL1284]|nr:hypothetical protein GGR52DRAFT_318939 [Hypoxylon sp. FL1284]
MMCKWQARESRGGKEAALDTRHNAIHICRSLFSHSVLFERTTYFYCGYPIFYPVSTMACVPPISLLGPYLLYIMAYLGRQDHLALRLTCKAFDAALFEAFGRGCFGSRTAHREITSLQKLVKISRSRLSSYVFQVRLNSQFMDYKEFHSVIVGTGLVEGGNAAERYQQYTDRQVFLDAGQDQLLLAEAFRGLCHLRSVEVTSAIIPWAFRD